MNYFLGDLILNQKEERMKFYKHSITICEAMNGEEILRCIWNIKDIAEMEISSMVMNY
jgi:hypothetical protein